MPAKEEWTVETVNDILIPMRDGVRLAGNLYRPRGEGRWPCLVNYLPYHKDGRGGLWYEEIHRFFARRGYASMVIDFRGLGCSEGINNTPFDAQEGRDGHDAVEWIGAQPWCDGNVGMWGTSYGGITALKTAAQRPPHLKAIVPVHATSDNFLDFLLLGGCRNGFWANGDWGPRMISYNLAPPMVPDPDGRLARLWEERLAASRPWCLDWYNAADEGTRWARRAIAIEQITAATFAVCGWKDFYVQGTLDYFQRLAAPKKLLMGPWKHVFPNLCPVEPVNLLELMMRWWDRWLRGQDNKIEAGPSLTIFVQGSGVWRQEEAWPPPRNQPRELFLRPSCELGAKSTADAGASLTYRYDPTVGLDSIDFDPWTTAVTEQGNHNGDDGRALCFTTAPLDEDWEVTGPARVVLPVQPSVGGFNYVAKLCDLNPDGRSHLVTMGWCPDPGQGDGCRRVEIALRSTAYVFRRGHRLRLNLALADFPRLWPSPRPGEIRLHWNAEDWPRLLLPHTPPQNPQLPAPMLPEPGPRLKPPAEAETSQNWRIGRELVQQMATLESVSRSRYHLRNGGVLAYSHAYTARVSAQNPAEVEIRVHSEVSLGWPGGPVYVIKANSVFTPRFVTIRALIERNGEQVFFKEWP